MPTPIGIDLGTTNSLIAAFEAGQPRIIANQSGGLMTPSVVAIDRQDRLVVGDAAKAMLVSDPTCAAAVFKRNLGTQATFSLGQDRQLTARELSALVLRDLKQTAQAALDEDICEAVISVPAYFNQKQRKEVVAAAEIADLSVTRLINEPTAAALAYGVQEREDESTFIVLDLGGGTFDVSVLEMFEGVMEVRSTAGDAFLGGEDFTQTLAEWIATENDTEFAEIDRALASIYYEIAEETKRSLAKVPVVRFNRAIQGQTIAFEIDRETFAEINSANTKRMRNPIERSLYDAKIDRDEIDRVILVGGATRMPLIRPFATKHLLRLPESTLDPDQVVAQGAAIQAALAAKDEALSDIVMTDVSAFTLGTEISKTVSGKKRISGFFNPIIERNSVVPISRVEELSTVNPGQDKVTLDIYQGEAPMVKDNIKIASFEVKIPYNQRSTEQFTVRFSYDSSGLLEVEVVTSDDKVDRLVIKDLAGDMSEREVAESIANLQSFKTHPRDQQLNIELLARLSKCYAMSLADDRDMIIGWITHFEGLLEKQDPREIEEARKRLSAMIDDYEDYYVS